MVHLFPSLPGTGDKNSSERYVGTPPHVTKGPASPEGDLVAPALCTNNIIRCTLKTKTKLRSSKTTIDISWIPSEGQLVEVLPVFQGSLPQHCTCLAHPSFLPHTHTYPHHLQKCSQHSQPSWLTRSLLETLKTGAIMDHMNLEANTENSTEHTQEAPLLVPGVFLQLVHQRRSYFMGLSG